MATGPFVWGAGGQKLSAGQARNYADISAKLAAQSGAPQSFGAGLNRVGEALLSKVYGDRADAAMTEGQQSVADMLAQAQASGDTDAYLGVIGNEWASPEQRSVAQALINRQFALDDRNAGWAREDAQLADNRAYDRPLRDLQMRQTEAEISALSAKPVVPPTDDMREYEMAQRQGFTGTLQDWIAAKPTTGTSVTVNTGDGSDAALDKALSTKEGEAWAGYKEAGTVSAANAQDFAVLDELIQIAPQGPVTGRLAETFKGFSSAGDAFQSIVKRIAPTLRAPGSGATSDIEYDGMLRSLPALSNTPEANAMIASIMKAKAQLNIERSEIITAYQNGDLNPDTGQPMTIGDARRKLNELDRVSIITPEMRSALLGVGGTGEIAPAVPNVGEIVDGYRFKGGNPADANSWEQVM